MKNTITGYTGLYGVVANPIKHSFSPMMHNTAFQTLGINNRDFDSCRASDFKKC